MHTTFDFGEFPVLATDRLILREPRRSDAAAALVFRGDPIVQKYDDPAIHTLAEAEAFIDDLREEYATRQGINWALTEAGADIVFGVFSLHAISRHHHRAEAGYGMARAYWGRGFGQEALQAVLRFGFTRLNLHRIYANTIADNHESVKLLERLGFRREGTQREHSWEDDGAFHDSAIYGLLRGEAAF